MHNARAVSLHILVASSLLIFAASAAESKSSKTTDEKDEAIKSDAAVKDKPAVKKQKVSKKDLLARQARIKFSKAEQIAQKQVPGKTQEIELGLEDGKLVYSVEIEGADGTKEVSIDAISGRVLKVEKDNDQSANKGDDKVTKNGGDGIKDVDEASD